MFEKSEGTQNNHLRGKAAAFLSGMIDVLKARAESFVGWTGMDINPQVPHFTTAEEALAYDRQKLAEDRKRALGE